MPFKGRRSYAKKLKVTATKKQKSTAVEQVKVKNIKSIVRNVLKKENELKTATNLTIADQVSVYGAGLNTPVGLGFVSASSIVPLIVQGAGESNRIGNSVRPKWLSLRFTLRAQNTTDAASPTNNNPFKGIPFLCRVIVFKHRWAIDEGSQTGILQTGSSSQNLGSTPDNWVMPYNTEEYKIYYSKQWKMQALGHISSTGAINTENQGYGLQNFIVSRCRIKMPKVLKFNDNNGAATNEGFFMAVAVCNADGSVISNIQTRVMINAESYLDFYDN